MPLFFFILVVKSTPIPVKLTIKTTGGDKKTLLAKYQAESASAAPILTDPPEAGAEGLPSVKYATEPTDAEHGWVTFDKPMLYI